MTIEKLKYFNMFKVKGLIVEYTFLQHILALIYCLLFINKNAKSGHTKTQVFPSTLCLSACFCSLDVMNRMNGENGNGFQSVSPKRHS